LTAFQTVVTVVLAYGVRVSLVMIYLTNAYRWPNEARLNKLKLILEFEGKPDCCLDCTIFCCAGWLESPLLYWGLRQDMRRIYGVLKLKLGIEGGNCGDCLTSCCCESCGIVIILQISNDSRA
jgi:hypothetical protein